MMIKKLILILFLTLQWSWSQSEDFEVADFGHYLPRFKNKKNFNESWNYQLYLNNRIQVFLELTRVNHGKDELTTPNMFFLNWKKGKNEHVASRFDKPGYFRTQKSQGNSKTYFHKKNVYFEATPNTHRVYFFREKDGKRYFLDIEFFDLKPGMTLKSGAKKLGGGLKLDYTLHFPHAKVRGKIAINDDTVSVNGFGMMDHLIQNKLPTKGLRRGIRYLKLDENFQSGFIVVSQKKKSLGIEMLKEGNGVSTNTLIGYDLGKWLIKRENKKDIKFKGFKKSSRWSVMDEVPGGGAISMFKKNLYNTRGIAYLNGSPYLITQLKVK